MTEPSAEKWEALIGALMEAWAEIERLKECLTEIEREERMAALDRHADRCERGD